MPDQPLLLWFRRDLRLADHPMLAAALDSGRPLLPVFILDPETEAIGAAAKWRLGEGIATFARALEALGSRLVLRRGPALEVLQALARETGAEGVRWSRLYDPASVARDRQVKAALRAGGLSAESHAGHLLHEPWEVQTGQGGFYKVYTPYWNAVRQRPVADALPAAKRLPAPAQWPESDRLEDWRMGASMQRGAAVVARYASVGEAAAQARLRGFLDARLERYAEARDLPGVEATSRLSEHLTYGEITPRAIWHAGMRALHEGVPGAEKFLKEVVWREFSYHLLHHTPQIASENWRNDWQSF
ncbi:deoxyribodipyrimidine photolyase, partial [Cereibacter changlensis JA139]